MLAESAKKSLLTDLIKCEEILMYRQDVTNLVKLKFFLHFEKQIRLMMDCICGRQIPAIKREPSDNVSLLPKQVITKESIQEVANVEYIISPYKNEDRKTNPFTRIKPNQSTIFEAQTFSQIKMEGHEFFNGKFIGDSNSERNLTTPSYDISNKSRKYSYAPNNGTIFFSNCI